MRFPYRSAQIAGRLSARELAAADPDHDGTLTLDEYLAVVEQRFAAADPDKDGTLGCRQDCAGWLSGRPGLSRPFSPPSGPTSGQPHFKRFDEASLMYRKGIKNPPGEVSG
jgi:hypothetical protein